MRYFLISCCILAIPLPAMAIFKCEANGKVTYSDERCKNQRVIELDPGLGSDLGEPEKARWQLEQQKAELKRLEGARLKRETRETRDQQKMAKLFAAKQKKCARLEQRKKWSEEDALLAKPGAKEKASLKARRMEESFQLECGK